MKTWLCIIVCLCGLIVAASAGARANREGLLLEYSFEGKGLDTSGNGYDPALKGSPASAQGKKGQCLAFAGADWVDSNLMIPELDTFTVECWVNPAGQQVAWADILGNHAGGGVSGMVLQQRQEETNQFSFVYGSTSGQYVETQLITLTPGQWHHVACVKDTREMRLYLNGVLMDAVPAEDPMAASTTPFRIGLGFENATRCFQGNIDEVRVWNRALDDFGIEVSGADQLALFEATAGTRDLLKVHWPHAAGTVAPGEKAEVELSVDRRFFPEAITAVQLAFEVVDYAGTPCPPLPAVTLRKDAAFTASATLPDGEGYYRITCHPVAIAGGRKVTLGDSQFTAMIMAEASRQASADAPAPQATPPVVASLNGDTWLLATDAENIGREQKWQAGPVPEAKQTKVPWIIQDAFPGYHGVAWYWRTFQAPANPHLEGRFVLHFAQVDYLAEVWVNGTAVGGHEGGETPFELDVTDAIKPGAENLLAVRVLNPTHERIDGIVLDETPHRCKALPYSAGRTFNQGGITGAVTLSAVPAVRIEGLHVCPDLQTGNIQIRATVRNAAKNPQQGRILFTVADAATGQSFAARTIARDLPQGDSLVKTALHVDNPLVWDLNHPHLYRVTARLEAGMEGAIDERAVRCGFRDFRFEEGYFRLNGRRIFLRSSHTVNNFAVGLQFPHDPDLARRDLLNAKVMGFNMVRFICGGATPEQLDLCDEIGLLVYEESYASWVEMVNTPHLKERFDRSIGEIIERDRNHPSIVIWGLLNEITDGPLFRHAVQSLPLLRFLDPSRVVVLNSGRWDGDYEIGTISNPGSMEWEPSLGREGTGAKRSGWSHQGGALGYFDHAGDAHTYLKVPQSVESTHFLRTIGEDSQHVFLSEYGIGSAVDLCRTVRHFQRLGKEHLEDAQFYKANLDRFMADWQRWGMDACFARPEDFFAASLARMASHRTLGLNAIRSNPYLVGHNLTGLIDHVSSGEGLTTLFREMKPGAIDAVYDGWAPLRLCLFAEPVNLYRGGKVKLEAVLANEDMLAPGDYPIHLEVVAPDGSKVLERTVSMAIPVPKSEPEPPFALPVFSEEVAIDGPAGAYRFHAAFEKGAAAAGGKTVFHIADAAAMPPVANPVTLWGEDPGLKQWLHEHGISTQPFSAQRNGEGDVILAGKGAPSEHRAEAFAELNKRIENGATAIFLCPAAFAEDKNPVAWLPPAAQGKLVSLNSWLYLMDVWGKDHPIFDGLPTKGLLDYVYYREIIRDVGFAFAEPPAEAIVGGIEAAVNYTSGLLLSVHHQGKGKVIMTTLLVRENLGTHPAAEHLLRNMLRYAGSGEVPQP